MHLTFTISLLAAILPQLASAKGLSKNDSARDSWASGVSMAARPAGAISAARCLLPAAMAPNYPAVEEHARERLGRGIQWSMAANGAAMALGPRRYLRADSKVRTVEALVTAYCPCRRCCGPNAQGITSTGSSAREPGCAVDPQLIPYGFRVKIPGIGWRTADDTGSAMRAHGRSGIVHIDIRMQSHEQALRFGARRLVVEVADVPKER